MDFIDFIVNFSEASESSHFPRFFLYDVQMILSWNGWLLCFIYYFECHELWGKSRNWKKKPTKSERIKKTLPSVDLKLSLSITRLFALPLWRIKLLLVVAIMNANDTSVDPISNEWGKVVSSFRIYYHFQAMLRITLKTFSSSFFAHPFYDR